MGGSVSAFTYMEAMFTSIAQFSDTATRDKTETEIVSEMGEVAEDATGIDADFFVDNLYSYEGYTRNVWKYAVKRYAAGTPWFVVNNVNLEVSASIPLVFDDWVELLDPIMPAART